MKMVKQLTVLAIIAMVGTFSGCATPYENAKAMCAEDGVVFGSRSYPQCMNQYIGPHMAMGRALQTIDVPQS